jgi:hypothetical protein
LALADAAVGRVPAVPAGVWPCTDEMLQTTTAMRKLRVIGFMGYL